MQMIIVHIKTDCFQFKIAPAIQFCFRFTDPQGGVAAFLNELHIHAIKGNIIGKFNGSTSYINTRSRKDKRG